MIARLDIDFCLKRIRFFALFEVSVFCSTGTEVEVREYLFLVLDLITDNRQGALNVEKGSSKLGNPCLYMMNKPNTC